MNEIGKRNMDKNKIGMLVAALLLITFTVAVTVTNHSTEGAAEAGNHRGGSFCHQILMRAR